MGKKIRRTNLFAFALILFSALALPAAAQRRRAQTKQATTTQTVPTSAAANAPSRASQALTVRTEPNATIWLDEVRRGASDATTGLLQIDKVAAGRHTLRVRAVGFAERVVPLLPAQRGLVAVRLTRTTDAAELTFQQAEAAREKATEAARKEAVELYRRALQLRPRFPAAHVGLARVLLDSNDSDGALEEIAAARTDRPIYAEAGAVEGRILHAQGDDQAAIAAYRRALRAARGFQPEAYTGLGIALEEKGNYAEAADAYSKAIAQLADTEPILYELLGRTYERLEKYKESVAAYEKYLQLAPDGKLAPAIRSLIEQLRQQANGGDIPLPPPA